MYDVMFRNAISTAHIYLTN